MRVPGFTANASLIDRTNPYWNYGCSNTKVGREQILPQQGYECGNQFLNTICPPMLNAAFLACWYVCLWDRYGSACRVCVQAHALPCAGCSGI